MDALRWLRHPGEKATPRPKRIDEHTKPTFWLRASDRRMAEALEQLREGVPLNWAQIDEDEELATLARLQPAVQKYRESTLVEAPAALREKVLQKLEAQLPQRRPVPLKAAPNSLAGFSENVQVLTQAEEDVPSLTSSTPVKVAVVVAGIVALGLLAWAALAIFVPAPKPAFTWLQVLQDGKPATNQNLPAGWKALGCRNSSPGGSPGAFHFQDMPSLDAIQHATGFPIVSVPLTGGVGTTRISGMNSMGFYSCEGLPLDSPDPGGIVRFKYEVRYQAASNAESTRVATGNVVVGPSTAGRAAKVFDFTELTVFEASELPVTVEASKETWKEVSIGPTHGFYWREPSYVDMAGEEHVADTSLLAVEDGDLVVVMIGRTDQGINEEMLTGIVSQMAFPKHAASQQATPTTPGTHTTGSTNLALTPLPVLNAGKRKQR